MALGHRGFGERESLIDSKGLLKIRDGLKMSLKRANIAIDTPIGAPGFFFFVLSIRQDLKSASLTPHKGEPMSPQREVTNLCVTRRRRCPCSASSTLFNLASQDPSANVILSMKQGTKKAGGTRPAGVAQCRRRGQIRRRSRSGVKKRAILPGIPEQPYGTQRMSLFEDSARIARECTVWNPGSTGEPLSPTLRVSIGPSIHG